MWSVQSEINIATVQGSTKSVKARQCAMEMMTNDTTMDPSSEGNGLGRRPREHRVTPLRHRMGQGGTEFAVLKTKVSVGLPMIFPLHLLHNWERGAPTRSPTHVLTLTSNTYPAYL